MRIFLLCGLLLVSCGKDDSKSESKSKRGAMLVATEADLPECAPEDEGWLVYVKDSGMQACLGGSWGAVEIPAKELPQKSLIDKQYLCGDKEFKFGTVTVDARFYMITTLKSGEALVSCSSVVFSGNEFDSDGNSIVHGPTGKEDGALCASIWVKMRFDFGTEKAEYTAKSPLDDEEKSASVTCEAVTP